MKKIFAILLVISMLFLLCSCQTNVSYTIKGTYVWEKEGFGGAFSITLYEGGTYSYYAGLLSSYIGRGSWTLDGKQLALVESGSYSFVFYFEWDGDSLVFKKEGSSKFMYVSVEDGDRFYLTQKSGEN